jgi:hypothetical protein
MVAAWGGRVALGAGFFAFLYSFVYANLSVRERCAFRPDLESCNSLERIGRACSGSRCWRECDVRAGGAAGVAHPFGQTLQLKGPVA